MREIKFRAYNRKTKNMWWFDLMWGNTDTHGSGWIGMLPIGETREHSGGINGSDNRTQVDPTDCEIMQFTGLKDSFDHEVYEGDIVTYGTEDGIVTALVEFAEEDSEDSMFLTGFQMKVIIVTDYEDGDDSDHAFEVCGNIYENPELLVSK